MNTSKTAPTILGKIEWAAAIIISLGIGLLHVIVLRHAGDLWRDEINTATVAQARTIAESWSLLPFESSPFLIHLLVRSWTAVMGGSDGVLRLFGFFVGIGIVVALWLNARMLGRSLPLFSLAVFAMNAVVIRFGDAVRSYGLGVFFMLLTVALVWRLATSPNRLTVVLATLSALGAVQSLYQNAFFVFAICTAGMAVTVRHRLWRRTVLILAVGGIAAISLVPYIPIIDRAQTFLVLYQDVFGFSRALKVTAETMNSSGVFMAGTLGVLLLLGAGIAVAAQFPKTFKLPPAKRDLALYSGVAAGIGLVCFGIFWKSSKLDMYPWYTILPLALLAVFLDAMAAVLPGGRLQRYFVLCLAAGLVAVSISTVWASSHRPHTNVGKIAAKLATAAGKDDLIVVIPWYCGTTFHRYYKGVTPWITIPELDNFEIQREDQFKHKLGTTNASASALGKVSRTLQSGNKLWLVGVPRFWLPDSLPPSLPTAPYGAQKWFAAPYLMLWQDEIGLLLGTHHARGNLIIEPTADEVRDNENLPLAVFEGWQ